MKTKKKGNFKKIAIKALLVFAGIYLVINVINAAMDNSLTITVAESGFLEDAIGLDGYIFRTQEFIYSSVGGVLEARRPDGERVSNGEHVATVYMGVIPNEVLEQLRQINERIAQSVDNTTRPDLFAQDPIAIQRQIAEGTSAIIEAAYLRDGERLARARRNLDDLIEKRNFAMGIVPEFEETVAQLERQRQEIETRYGVSRSELRAPRAGAFVSNIDGLEEYLTIDRISSLLPADIDELSQKPLVHNTEVVPGRPAAKIVDNYRWYFVAAIDTRRIHPLRVGSNVTLRFFDATDVLVDGTVNYISQDVDGRSVIAISARGYVDSVYGLSRVSVDLIRRTYRGLRIETAAIRVLEDGRTGVFILRNNRAWFREVNVLHNAGDWSIIEETRRDTIAGGIYLREEDVRVFDEIIISSREFENGDLVR